MRWVNNHCIRAERGGEGDILSLSTYETASKVCSFASSRLLGWITYFFIELKWFGG